MLYFEVKLLIPRKALINAGCFKNGEKGMQGKKKSEDKIYPLKSVALLVQQQQQQEKQKTSDNQLHPISKTDEKGKKSTKKMAGKKAEMKVPELLCNGLD